MQYNREEKEDAILLARLADKIRQSELHYMMTYSSFLDLRQRGIAQSFLEKQAGLRWDFYGGYEDAERCIALFFPDYADVAKDSCTFFKENPEEDPLRVIRVQIRGGKEKLTHRDYLGSLIGLGLKREVIGDILVRGDGADILVDSEIADFLMTHYIKAGRVSLSLSLLPVTELAAAQRNVESREDTVASLRLDNVVASVFSMSRGKAADAIRSGSVFVNNLQIQKADKVLKEGDRLVVRGSGKAILSGIGGRTRKDRTVIRYQRYK